MLHLPRPRPVRPGYWFAQKRYGIGSVPATAMGWVVTAIFVLLLGLAMHYLPTNSVRSIVALGLLVLFCAICRLKTDGGWQWRWGDDGKEG